MSALGDILGGSSSDDDDDFFGNASDEEVLREAQQEAIKNASSDASSRSPRGGRGDDTGRAGERKGRPALDVKARSEQEQTRRGRNNRNSGSTQHSRDRDGSRDGRAGRGGGRGAAAARNAGEEDGEVYEAEPYKQTPSEIAALAPPPPIPYVPRNTRPCRNDGHCARPGCMFVHSGTTDGSNGVPCPPAGTAGAYPPRGGGGGGAFGMGMAGMPGMPSSGLMMVPGHPPVLLPGAARPPLPSTMIPRGTSLPPSLGLLASASL